MAKAPDWMNEEKDRASAQVKTGTTTNADAPQLQRVSKAPERKQKAFFVQVAYSDAFEDFVIKEKREKGKDARKAPEMAEQMIKDFLAANGVDVSKL